MINENDPSTLTTSGRLLNYNEAIKSGLETGLTFTKLMDQLIKTHDADELVAAATQLADFKLDSDYVTFPHQYSNADYYLLFMSRMLELHDQGKHVMVQSRDHHEELTQQLTPLGDRGTFSFRVETSENGGVFYRERATGQSLFYLNLERKMFRFNSHALTQLFIIDLHDTVPADTVKASVQILVDFARYLKEDYGYSVDFNVLDAANQQNYAVRSADLPAGVVDRLFVAAAKNDYMLTNGVNGNGAQIQLDKNVVVDIFNNQLEGQPEWVLTVHDDDQKVSWFDILLRYPFMRDWYLENLDDLEIVSDPLIFS
ncbi:hypothetical protein [Levilactobacillus zymae]|uniref:Uncharacterized protein n=1 Tax=Levilactobacillus zymae TaxID=267363 RepID=A0A1Y6JX10_9LACO|nr:hypothetical protein [Levilactobacillus zymae]KRL07356.1 hypothetical protein FD38_GL000270 [Levilactobacillus zymae DSM 19395]QFR60469.1 hypothetical protein LZ395_02565 [Levilactobacillus zymae]GEO71819.1 hypothetical protein LZY01_09870 [Levilactobacillus zymae]SMS14478.1 FIG00742372: hypothetical protein [Levilactobacillus zymae]